MFGLLDQLLLAHFSAKTINCSSASASAMLPIYLEARLAICQHFDDNGILSINFFGMVCAYVWVCVQLCTQKHFHAHICYCFSWLFSSHTHTHTHPEIRMYVWHLDRRFSLLSGCFLTCCSCQCKLSCLLFRSAHNSLFIYLPVCVCATATNLCDIKLNCATLIHTHIRQYTHC